MTTMVPSRLFAAALAALLLLPGGDAARLLADPAGGSSTPGSTVAPSTSLPQKPSLTGQPRSGRARAKRQSLPPASPDAALVQALRIRMRRSPLRGPRVGAIVVSLKDGHTIFESQPDRPLSPASTMKVLTSAAILDRLGPDWRYETRFLSEAPPEGGVLAGNLYVKGSCEPDLVVERFDEIAQGILDAGVREVKGDVVADLLYFDGEERPPEWPRGSRPNIFASPISALAANFSTVRVTVAPGPRPGAPAAVSVDPPSDVVPFKASVTTSARGGSWVRATRRLESLPGGAVGNRILVSGRISQSAEPVEEFVPIEDPAGVAVSAVKRALQARGISVYGTTRIGAAPPDAVPVFTLRSKPLAEIIRDMNKQSNNYIAEMLQRTLGAEVYGPPANREKGAAAVAAFLRSCGIDPDRLTLTDGSGLSRSNQITPNALVRVLIWMRGDPRLEEAFVDSLPIGGVDGTLKGRMGGIARGRVRAKTGTIDGVTTLAGYVDDTVLGPVAFSFLVNDAPHSRAVIALDDLCRILCSTW